MVLAHGDRRANTPSHLVTRSETVGMVSLAKIVSNKLCRFQGGAKFCNLTDIFVDKTWILQKQNRAQRNARTCHQLVLGGSLLCQATLVLSEYSCSRKVRISLCSSYLFANRPSVRQSFFCSPTALVQAT